MSAAPAQLAALRDLLASRFPTAARVGTHPFATGVAALDQVAGGLPIGALTELVCHAPSSGGSLLLGRLFESTREQCLRVALIDSTDTLDPQSFPPDQLAHLVWVRCLHVTEAMQAADLLARDANLGLVILDLRGSREDELRRISPTSWYRLQRAVEQNEVSFLIMTSRSLVPSAALRFSLSQTFTLSAFDLPRASLASDLTVSLQRQRRSLEEEAG